MENSPTVLGRRWWSKMCTSSLRSRVGELPVVTLADTTKVLSTCFLLLLWKCETVCVCVCLCQVYHKASAAEEDYVEKEHR